MAWIQLILALMKAVGAFSEYLQQKQLIDVTTASIVKQNMENAINAVQKAKTARKTAADKFAASGGVPDKSDPNLRD